MSSIFCFSLTSISFTHVSRDFLKNKQTKKAIAFCPLTIGEFEKTFQMGNIYEKSHLSEK